MKDLSHSKINGELAAATIYSLSPGDWGIVIDITAPEPTRQRLIDMGISYGSRVEMVRSAPLGDPILIRVLDTLLALRKQEAQAIVIDYHRGERHERQRHRRRAGRKS
jgi:ferrous iron transport protein A